MNFREYLISLNACADAVAWVGDQTAAEAWAGCQRGDWMLWLLGKESGAIGSGSRRKLVGCAAECAELALPLFEARYPDDKRPRQCVETCKAYALGEATLEDVRKARSAAYAAADAAYAAAAYAAAAYAAYAAAAYAAYAAAADAAYAYAADAAADAARVNALAQCATIVRRHYPAYAMPVSP